MRIYQHTFDNVIFVKDEEQVQHNQVCIVLKEYSTEKSLSKTDCFGLPHRSVIFLPILDVTPLKIMGYHKPPVPEILWSTHAGYTM